MDIISGMHRSGTSLVARIVFEAGADFGDPTTFYRADRWNPDGYFEQPEIQAINRKLTQGPFWKLAYFRLPSTRTILARAGRMSAQIRAAAMKYRDRVVKETRYCLTLPAWLENGAQVRKLLVCLRDPVQVALSIRKRNKITLGHAYSLWATHNRRLLENAASIPLWFVLYRDVLDEQSFMKEMGAALRFLDIEFTETGLRELGKKIVNPSLNRHPEVRSVYPRRVETIWNELLERHASQNEASVGPDGGRGQ